VISSTGPGEGPRGPAALTQALGQQVLDELGVVADVQHAVDAGVHQVLLLAAQVLAHVLRHEHDVALHVDHEEEAVERLRGGGEGGRGGGERENEKTNRAADEGKQDGRMGRRGRSL